MYYFIKKECDTSILWHSCTCTFLHQSSALILAIVTNWTLRVVKWWLYFKYDVPGLSSMWKSQSLPYHLQNFNYMYEQKNICTIFSATYEFIILILWSYPGLWNQLKLGYNLQVVKAFIIRTEKYKARDEEELRKELQEHVKSITAPYKYPRKVWHFYKSYIIFIFLWKLTKWKKITDAMQKNTFTEIIIVLGVQILSKIE